MVIDGKGCVLEGASIQLSKGDLVYNAILRDCQIDDDDWDWNKSSPFEACQLIDCMLLSQWKKD